MGIIKPDRGGGSGGPREYLRPGPYLLALVWFTRKTGKDSGKRYLSVKYEVIGGRFKGRSFFSMLALDLSKDGTIRRWQMYGDAVGGIDEEWELGEWDEDNEDVGDENIRRLFLRKPFGAEVSKKTENGYTNNEVNRYVFPKAWTEEWQTWAEEYRQAQAARSRRAPEDDLEEPAPNSPQDVGYPDQDDGFSDPPPPPPRAAYDDDDIPF